MCDILVPWRSLNGSNKRTEQRKKEVEQKRRRLAEEEARTETSRAFSAYRSTLKMVPSFKYLGGVLLAVDDDWLVVMRNLTKAQEVWRRILRILSR